MQCLSKFLALRNEHLRQHSPITQGESQDEFGDMDFDYDDPALNAMLGIPEVETSANAAASKELDPLQLDRQFVEIVKTSISPRLYAILSDLNAINSGQETGVPEFQNKEAYADNLAEVWASCAVVLVQKNQRDWKYYMDPFGKESWQRFADGLQRLETGCVFSCVMLGSDSKAYKVGHRNSAPVQWCFSDNSSSRSPTATLLSRSCSAVWQPLFLLDGTLSSLRTS